MSSALFFPEERVFKTRPAPGDVRVTLDPPQTPELAL